MESTNKIVIFQQKEIRRVWQDEQWYFVIEDIVGSLTDSSNSKNYVRDMRRRDPELSKGWGQIAHTLSVETIGGKQRMNCANTEGVLRSLKIRFLKHLRSIKNSADSFQFSFLKINTLLLP